MAAKEGYFRLEHSSVNAARSKAQPNKAFGKGYMAAKANYAANTNKCSWIMSVNMPEDRHDIRAFIASHERSLTRKNAHLGDTMIVSLPTQLSEDHRRLVTQRFL